MWHFGWGHILQAITGLKSEFISGGRLDNLVGTYTAIRALIESVSNEAALDDETNIRLAICFDNEEVSHFLDMISMWPFKTFCMQSIRSSISYYKCLGHPIGQWRNPIALYFSVAVDQRREQVPVWQSGSWDDFQTVPIQRPSKKPFPSRISSVETKHTPVIQTIVLNMRFRILEIINVQPYF